MSMDGLIAWVLANGYTDEVGSGISALNPTPTGFELVTTTGTTLSFTIPNLHIHSNLNILEKLSLDTNNKLLFDGKPIKESIDLTNYVQKEVGKGLFTGDYNDLINKPVTQQPNKSISFTSSDWVQDSIELDKYNLEITHGLKTIDVVCVVYNSANEEETLGVDVISADRIILTTYSAPISGRIVISYASTTGTNTGIQDLNNFTTDNLAEGVNNKYISAKGKAIVESINLTSPTNGQVLSFDSIGKIVNETIYDEKVKMSASDTNAQYISDLLDGDTVQNVSGKIVVKNIDGVTVGVSNINTLSGMTDNIKAKFDALSNAMKFTGIVSTKADLNTVVGMSSGDVKIVLADESNLNKKITYVYDGTSWNSLGEFNITVRDFSTSPIQLSNTGIEITGILEQSHINMTGIIKDTDVIDDLTHTDINKPISANQAKVLKGLADGKTQVNDGVTSSTVDTYSVDKIMSLLNNKQNKIYIQSTQPISPTINTIWIDTTNNINYLIKCYNGSGFIQIGSIGDVTITGTQTLTNKSLVDSSTKIIDGIDNTKVAQFEASGITTGTTRTLTIPDKNGTIATTDDITNVTDQTLKKTSDVTFNSVDLGTGTKVKMKKFTGIMPSVGTSLEIAHGLTQSKIISFTCMVNSVTLGINTLRIPFSQVNSDIEYNIRIKASTIWLTTGASGTLIAGYPYTVVIWYEV
jgi:hypothetical protein